MTTPDPYPAGLDPVHILAICTRATGSDTGIQATGTADAVRVSFPARHAAWTAHNALGRVGYTAAHASEDRRTRDLIVTGWNADRLETRLNALSKVMYGLASNPLVSATAGVRRFAALPARAATPDAASEIVDETRQFLHDWVDSRTGICVPVPPARLPGDTTIAMLIRATSSCEGAISDLIDRQVRVTESALTQFVPLRQRMNDSRALRTAVRRAGAFFHLSRDPVAQDSTSPMSRSAPTANRGETAANPRSRASRPRQGMSGEFPAPPGATGPAGADPSAGTAGPGGQDFPAARPDRRHP